MKLGSVGGKRINTLLALSFLLLLPAFSYAQSADPATSVRIGYVDLKRLIDNAPQMVISRARLESEFAHRDTALKTDETRLADLKQRLARDGAILSKNDADALKHEVDTLERSVKRTRDELRSELNTRAAAERDRVWQDINNTVVEFAREQGYDLVLPSPVVYASARIDITEQVLERLKRQATAHPEKP